MDWNKEQIKVINEAKNHVLKPTSEQVYQFSGAAGTGKTAVLKEIIKQIGSPLSRVPTMAYIGQAANVMRTRGLYNAKTIHSWLYEPVKIIEKDKDGNPIMDPIFNKPKITFKFIPRDLSHVDYMIIDEGFTAPLRMRHDILKVGKPVIVCGDVNQLPPVKDKPAFLVDGNITYLTQIMRHKNGSDIPYIAQRILEGKPIHPGMYRGVLVIRNSELTEEMIRYANIILCGTNRSRDYYNRYVRDNIMDINTKLPLYGEKVICRKTNWNEELDGISLTNGLIGTVMKPPQVDNFEGKNFKIDFRPDFMNNQFEDLLCNYDYFVSDYNLRSELRNSPYAFGNKFEFAYAITTHLSQGAQYPSGIYIHEYLRPNIQRNLDYTGVTRFKKFLIYVIPDKKYF